MWQIGNKTYFKMMNIPVLLIAYNRKENTLKVLDCLREVQVSTLYIACDGAKESAQDKEKVQRTREAVQAAVDWECSVQYRFSDRNQGCKYGPVNAINWIFEKEEWAIILEDDIVPNSSFFLFCEELLARYKNREEIMMISGCNIMSRTESAGGSYFFEPIATTWGWATWKRAWEKYDVAMQGWREMKKRKVLKRLFLKDTAFSLRRDFEIAAENDTDIWDYQWQYTMIKSGGFGIVPKYCMVRNIGFNDKDATHTNAVPFKYKDFLMPFPLIHPQKQEGNREYELYVETQIYRVNYWHLLVKKVLPKRMAGKIRKISRRGDLI